ncbi:hypothetical protein R1sor_005261 [Riccia sorocarpa]|uniref:Uncharacterized protein n=1 Tax=Riccia sorocarpa TaxID=122646 RepID=A0ABD3HNE9_9MARC
MSPPQPNQTPKSYAAAASPLPAHTPDTDQEMKWSESSDGDNSDGEQYNLSDVAGDKANDQEYMKERKWRRSVMREVTTAYSKLPDRTGRSDDEEVIIEHTLNFDAQLRIQNRKRKLEDCTVVSCTVDLSPSRDGFLQWLYQEVENKAAVQIAHVQDVFHLAKRKSGPRYTRQAIRGNRLDQARLDRVYLNRGGDWILQVPEIEHDSREALSDHISVIFSVQVECSVRKKKCRKTSYLKMDVDSLKCPARREKAKPAWEEGWRLSPDLIGAWELAWGKMKEVFKEFRAKDRRMLSKLQVKQAELAVLRLTLDEDKEKSWSCLGTLEQEVHRLELIEASIMRRRSRITWAKEGDECTKFFFSCLKTKQQRERMGTLLDEQGVTIEDEECILDRIHTFYSSLYR